MQKKSKNPVTVELFCGAGGTSFGFASAGFDIRLGVDIDPVALSTFAANHPGAAVLCASVSDRMAVNGRTIRRLARAKTIDVLIGGPSCQGYSTIGKRIEDDPRNGLFAEYIRIVDELRPRWLLFENVPGMRLYSNGRFLQELCTRLQGLGYAVTWDVLNAADYGVPQRRNRLFLVGTSDPVSPSMPRPTHEDPRCPSCSRPDGSNRIRRRALTECGAHAQCSECHGSRKLLSHRSGRKPWITVEEAIGDLPIIGDSGGSDELNPYSAPPTSAYQKRMRVRSRGYDLHKARPVSSLAYSIIQHVSEGQGLRAVPSDKLPERFLRMRTIRNGTLRRDCTTLYHRLSRELPSYTITCYFTNVSSGAFTHPSANRAITCREGARLQSFPDRFVFTHKNAARQIGNAVPPILAESIARHLLKLIRARESGLSRRNRIRRRGPELNEIRQATSDVRERAR